VEVSNNVLVEDLQSTRSLETTYYVTDATQAYDSFWDRESGLRVHIGVSNVHLIPEYEDVEHDADNNYMLDDDNDSEDKSAYRAMVHNFCRSESVPRHCHHQRRHLQGGPFGPASRWAATSNVEVGQEICPVNRGMVGMDGRQSERGTKSQRGKQGQREWNGEGA